MKSPHPAVFKIPFWVSIFVTLFLFCIDEGFNDFRWMQDPGNWFVFVIYVAGIYIVLLLIALLIDQLVKLVKRMAN